MNEDGRYSESCLVSYCGVDYSTSPSPYQIRHGQELPPVESTNHLSLASVMIRVALLAAGITASALSYPSGRLIQFPA